MLLFILVSWIVTQLGFPYCLIAFIKLSLLPLSPLAFEPKIERVKFDSLYFLFDLPLLFLFLFSNGLRRFIAMFGYFPTLVGFAFVVFVEVVASLSPSVVEEYFLHDFDDQDLKKGPGNQSLTPFGCFYLE